IDKKYILISSRKPFYSLPYLNPRTITKIISQFIDISRQSSSTRLAKFKGIALREKSLGKRRDTRNKKMVKNFLTRLSFLWLCLISVEP
ncbi:MAG: hypothetical protein WA097_05095, partial [Candidatus Hydromicrobium sp.]